MLIYGDIANHYGNWQWVAGTGNDSPAQPGANPIRQALRFDPGAAYVRRYVPELAEVGGPDIHTPWRLPTELRRWLGSPEPISGLNERPAMLAVRGWPRSGPTR